MTFGKEARIVTHAFTVEDRFDIAGRMVALLPGIPASRIAAFREEKKAELRRPDGSLLEVSFSIPFVDPYDPKRPWSIMVSRPTTKEDIPVGTEVWIRSKEEPNQALEPMRTAVTPPADAGDRASGAHGSS